MRLASCIVFALCLFLILIQVQGQAGSASSPYRGTSATKSFTDARLALREGELRLTTLKLQMTKASYRVVQELLATWKNVVENDWTEFSQQEKTEFFLYLEHTLQTIDLLQPGETQKEALLTAVAAFRGEKIEKPTVLQKKIMALPSKEENEARRIAFTIRECLRYSAEDMAPINKRISEINHELEQISATRIKLSPKKKEK